MNNKNLRQQKLKIEYLLKKMWLENLLIQEHIILCKNLYLTYYSIIYLN